MDAQLSDDRSSLTFTSPPNPNIYPPGPAYIFLTVDDVTSEGREVLIGTGAPPFKSTSLEDALTSETMCHLEQTSVNVINYTFYR